MTFRFPRRWPPTVPDTLNSAQINIVSIMTRKHMQKGAHGFYHSTRRLELIGPLLLLTQAAMPLVQVFTFGQSATPSRK